MMTKPLLDELRTTFGDHLLERVSISEYTTSHVGGMVDILLIVQSSHELENAARIFWKNEFPFRVIGNGSNILVSDRGYAGAIIINKSRDIRINPPSENRDYPIVWAESGVNLSSLARKMAFKGYSGLEWASGIPATIGGAVYGNAGAHGSNTQTSLIMAEILHRYDREVITEQWASDQMEYAYRSSIFKRQPEKYTGNIVILAAEMKLIASQRETVQATMDEINEKRQKNLPAGASTGSTFKNPLGDYAGRLIEAAGLKGIRIGGAEISTLHANFILNQGNATASDYYQLIRMAQQKVSEQFGVNLELEIELIGEWND